MVPSGTIMISNRKKCTFMILCATEKKNTQGCVLLIKCIKHSQYNRTKTELNDSFSV